MKALRNPAGAMLVFLMAFLVGCAQLGVPTPDTVNQKIAIGISTVSSVRDTAGTLLVAGKITSADAENIQKQADTAREGLTVARSLSGKDLTAADNKVEAATAVLKALQAYLLTKQGAK